MRQIFTVAVAALTLASLSCGRVSSKSPIGHSITGGGLGKDQKPGKGIGDNSKCLDLRVGMSSIKDGSIVNVYVSDVDLGSISETDNTFTAIDNSAARARAALVLVKPQFENTTGKKLAKTSMIKDLLAVATQSQCKTITFQGGEEFEIFGSQSGVLRARNKATQEYREFIFDNSGILTINVYTPAAPDCDGNEIKAFQKISYIATWDANFDWILMAHDFAQTIALFSDESNDFAAALAKANDVKGAADNSVRLSEPVYRSAVAILGETDLSALQCKKKNNGKPD